MRYLALFLLILYYQTANAQPLEADSWTYQAVDEHKQKWGDWDDPEWLRYFGLDFGDIDQDGLVDIVSGRYIYHNPGGNMLGTWKRTVLDDNVDAIFVVNVDDDAYADIIAMALPNLYWYEALDQAGTIYQRTRIAQVPATSHVNSQGFEKADIIPGGKPELLIAGNGNVYCIQIPSEPEAGTLWPTDLIAENTSDEGIGFGDLDGDGDLDLACGRRPEGAGEPTIMVWFQNPGNINGAWPNFKIGQTDHPIDRIEIADFNGDGQSEIVMAEERYPGLEPDGSLIRFSPQANLKQAWDKHIIATQYSSNNLDAADIDQDGDLDLLTGEHKGPKLELQIWENDGKANFQKRVIDTGKENHLGTKWLDLDKDGDLDIVGAAWDNYKNMHLWVNQTTAPEAQLNGSPNDIEIYEITYEEAPHFLIKTKYIIYYYDQLGGGFSRIIDAEGNDWVSFKKEPWGQYPASAAAAFRGLPNLVWQGEDDGAGHPGFTQCNSRIEGETIYTKSKNGKWEWRWTFADDHAQLEVLKANPERNYWFLYEGTPGGKYQPERTYFGTDHSGPSYQQYDYFKNNLLQSNLQWMYCGTEQQNRIFYIIQLEQDEKQDMISFLGNSEEGIKSKDGMTVWGFGRTEEPKPLLSGKNRFIIGFYREQITTATEHKTFAQFVEETFLSKD
ncbi:MAG: VCBS repeat-containing protein [Bacteroidota bacterium]